MKKDLLAILKKAGAVGIIVGVLISVALFVNSYFGLEDDNMIEDAIEDVIEHHTGLDIDISQD